MVLIEILPFLLQKLERCYRPCATDRVFRVGVDGVVEERVKLRASNARGEVVPHLVCAAVVFVFYQARESCSLIVGMHTALGKHKAGFWSGHTTDGDTNTPKCAV